MEDENILGRLICYKRYTLFFRTFICYNKPDFRPLKRDFAPTSFNDRVNPATDRDYVGDWTTDP